MSRKIFEAIDQMKCYNHLAEVYALGPFNPEVDYLDLNLRLKQITDEMLLSAPRLKTDEAREKYMDLVYQTQELLIIHCQHKDDAKELTYRMLKGKRAVQLLGITLAALLITLGMYIF